MLLLLERLLGFVRVRHRDHELDAEVHFRLEQVVESLCNQFGLFTEVNARFLK